MKMIIVVALALVAVAAAAPVDHPVVQILRYSFSLTPDNGYKYEYETSDGVIREEVGEVKEVPNEEGKLVKAVVVTGFYTQPDDSGRPVITQYHADENGYSAEGENIPKNPQ